MSSASLISACLLVALAACTLKEVKTAERHAAKGQWDEAVAAYREAARKDPYDESIKLRMEQAKARAAQDHFVQGRRLMKDGRYSEALQELKTAAALAPGIEEHRAVVVDVMRLKEARDQYLIAEKLRTLGHVDEAMDAYEKAVKLDPTLMQALEGISALSDLQRQEGPSPGLDQPLTLRFQNTKLREVFEIIARTANVNIVVDKDVRDDPITIFLKETPLEQGLNLILNTNSLVARRLAPDTLVIVPNTKQKLEQYQDLMIRTFYLSNAKAKDLVNMLRSMLETKRIFVNEQLNAIVMRDRPEKLRLAERMILANDRREPEVLFDLEVLEVNRTKFLQYGVQFSKQGKVDVVGQVLKKLGPESFILTLPNSFTLDFLKTESDARTLAAPKLRVVNNKQGKITVGDKQPILLSTSNVLPGTALTGAIPTTSTVTSIEFKDVGVKLTVEPVIHLTNEITLKVQIEVTRVGEQVELQASPRIAQFKFGTRAAETILTLKDDETVVLGGLIQDEDRKQRSTVPILGDIPWLGQLFSSDQKNTVTTEVILTITPHIVKEPSIPDIDVQELWSGTESTYSTKPLFQLKLDKNKNADLDSKISTRPIPDLAITGSSSGSSAPSQGSSATAPAGGTFGEPGPGEVARLALQPREFIAKSGQEFQLDVLVDNLESLTNSVLALHFNPRLIVFQGAREGELLTHAGGGGSVTVKGDPLTGKLELHVHREGIPASGQGTLMSLKFKAAGTGVSIVEIPDVSIAGANAKSIAAVPGRGVVRVQ
jgi:general secretion pathway protein D